MTPNKSDKLFYRLAKRNQSYARGRRMQLIKRHIPTWASIIKPAILVLR